MGGDDWRGSTGIKLMASFSFSKAAGVICIISDSGEVMALKAPTGDAVNQIIYLAGRCVVVCVCVLSLGGGMTPGRKVGVVGTEVGGGGGDLGRDRGEGLLTHCLPVTSFHVMILVIIGTAVVVAPNRRQDISCANADQWTVK